MNKSIDERTHQMTLRGVSGVAHPLRLRQASATISETILNQQSQITNLYVWGLDLSGTLQGAGGIGGLLSDTLGGTTSVSSVFFTADANGNIGQLLDAANPTNILAHYEYSPFGETLVAVGDLAKANPFRFSTKYHEDESGLVYYGYRYYNPELGRWVNRDPIGEDGGYNLLGIANNNLVNETDYLGLMCSCLLV